VASAAASAKAPAPVSDSDVLSVDLVSVTDTLKHDAEMKLPPKRIASVDTSARPSSSTRRDAAPKKEVVPDAVARSERTKLAVNIPESKPKAMCVHLYNFAGHMFHEVVYKLPVYAAFSSSLTVAVRLECCRLFCRKRVHEHHPGEYCEVCPTVVQMREDDVAACKALRLVVDPALLIHDQPWLPSAHYGSLDSKFIYMRCVCQCV
jgi:hypothetical protein